MRSLPCFRVESRILPGSVFELGSNSDARIMLKFSKLTEFDFRSTEYVTLFARSDATAFQHPIWLDHLYSCLVPGTRLSPLILTARTVSGRLVLVLPLIKRRYGPFVLIDAADLGVNDYNAIVVDRDFIEEIRACPSIQELLGLSPLCMLRLRKIRGDKPDLIKSLGPCAIGSMGYSAHEVALCPPFDRWQSTVLRPSFARFLIKKKKEIAKKGELRLDIANTADQFTRAFECLREFRTHRWQWDLLRNKAYFGFYLRIASNLTTPFLTRTYVISISGEIVAVIFGLAHDRQFLALLTGFNINKYRNYSLGLLSLEKAMENCIVQGDQIFDFTIGDRAYKADFSTRPVSMLVFWFGRGPAPSISNIVFRCWARIRPLITRDARKIYPRRFAKRRRTDRPQVDH